MPDWNPRANEIFLSALTKGDSCKAYLDTACGDDTALRRAVEDMLAAHQNAGSFLDKPAAGVVATNLLPPLPESVVAGESVGSHIGPYVLVQKLGEGGMGAVWLADQLQPVRRQVALKIIRTGMDSKQVLTRFAHERQALALMDHPNIARVFDGGTTPVGLPYFVMELVRGLPFNEYSDQANLSLRRRLELFVPICQAVQHAHQKGIIHRDLKPGNVVVADYDGKPMPKVIDFGIAKAIAAENSDQTLLTSEGMIVGTLEYMAPEQFDTANQDIDTRADIYALGVMLYEILTGSVPFTAKQLLGGGLSGLVRIMHEIEPPAPSTRLSSCDNLTVVAKQRKLEPGRLVKMVRGDLDWIVMKCLEKKRHLRYDTANGLAMDLQRHLRDEPVLAGRPTVTYRIRKFVRRHRGPVMAAGLLVLALLAGFVGTYSGMVEAEQSRVDEQKQRVKAEQALEEKEEARRLASLKEQEAKTAAEAEKAAKHQAEKRLEQIEKANDILASIFKDLNPRLEESGGPGLLVQLGTRLDKAAELLEGEETGDPVIVAKVQLNLGQTLNELGFSDKAIAVLTKCRKTLETYKGSDDPDTLNSMHMLAMAMQVTGQFKTAQPLLEETLAKRMAVLPPDHADTLATMHNLAVVYRDTGQLQKAVPLFEETLQKAQKTLGNDNIDTLSVMNNLAVAYQFDGKLDKALPLLEETVRLRQIKLPPDHVDTLGSMHNLAQCYQLSGQTHKAVALLQEVLDKMKAKRGPRHPDTLRCMNTLGMALRAGGKLLEAMRLLEETLDLMKVALPADHPNALVVMNNLGLVYREAKKLDESIALLETAVEKLRIVYPENHPDTISAIYNLGVAYREARKFDKALPNLDEAVRKAKIVYGLNHPSTWKMIENTTICYYWMDKLDEAAALLEELLVLRKAKLPPDHPDTLLTKMDLGFTYAEADKHAKAAPLLTEWLAIKRPQLPEDDPLLARCLAMLANCQVGLKQYPESEKSARDSLEIYLKKDPNSALRYVAESLVGASLAGQKKHQDAEPFIASSAETFANNAALFKPWEYRQAIAALGRAIEVYEALERPEDAERWRKELDKVKATKSKSGK